jgi:HEAT repeat protein
MTDAIGRRSAASGHRPLGLWLALLGGFLFLVQIALAVLWWKLPQWAPGWVVRHSPWPAPVLRTLRYERSSEFQEQVAKRVWDWGGAIGTALRRQYAQDDYQYRVRLLYLANEVVNAPGIPMSSISETEHGLAPADVEKLREELHLLVVTALAGHSDELAELASSVAARLEDVRAVQPMCDYLRGRKLSVTDPSVENVVASLGTLGDPRAVPYLIPLLPIRHKYFAVVNDALAKCLRDDSVIHVLAATRHQHPVIRMWAAEQFPRFRTSPELGERLVAMFADPERDVSVAAINAAGEAMLMPAAPALLRVAELDGDPQARLAAVEGLGRLAYPSAGPYLRTLAQTEQEALRGAAIIALGALRDARDFPLFLALLRNEDDDIARKARIALGRLPLTVEQHRQVDALWKDPSP